jgi:hypothetical protein
MLLLTLPSSSPLPPASPSKRKRREPATAPPQQRLESFMDKLAMWQLLPDGSQGRPAPVKSAEDLELDWTQRFCVDIIQPL